MLDEVRSGSECVFSLAQALELNLVGVRRAGQLPPLRAHMHLHRGLAGGTDSKGIVTVLLEVQQLLRIARQQAHGDSGVRAVMEGQTEGSAASAGGGRSEVELHAAFTRHGQDDAAGGSLGGVALRGSGDSKGIAIGCGAWVGRRMEGEVEIVAGAREKWDGGTIRGYTNWMAGHPW